MAPRAEINGVKLDRDLRHSRRWIRVLHPMAGHFQEQFPQRRHPAHLPLSRVFNRTTAIFLTACVRRRRPLLNRPEIHELLRDVWSDSMDWVVGRYVLMPDHLHLFCAPTRIEAISLGGWVRYWKRCSSRRWPHPDERPVWQDDFWDRQLRSSESYAGKWNYVADNPVRAGLCAAASDWPYSGEIVVFRFHDAQ